jgi:hypothetical protein
LQVWLTVALSRGRFFCVRFPLKASRLCTPRRALFVALIILIVSLTFNIPRFFFYSSQLHVNPCTGHKHFHNKALPIFLKNEFLLLKWFYVEVLDALIYYILPLGLLVFLNAALVLSLRAASRKRNQMITQSEATSSAQKQHSKRDNMITLTLIVVGSAFIVFETPSAIYNIVEFPFKILHIESFVTNETVEISMTIFSLIMTLLNSSLSLLLFLLVNRNFRNELIAMFSYKR